MKLARSKQSKTTNNQDQPTSWKRQCASFECLNTNVKLWAVLYVRGAVYVQNGNCCLYRPLCTHITRGYAVAQACSCITVSFLESHPQPPHTCQLCRMETREIYTDFHRLAKKPRNYRVVNTSVIMGAENLYFWLLTFVKSFKNGFYSAKLLGKQPTDLYHSKISRSLGESLVKCSHLKRENV